MQTINLVFASKSDILSMYTNTWLLLVTWTRSQVDHLLPKVDAKAAMIMVKYLVLLTCKIKLAQIVTSPSQHDEWVFLGGGDILVGPIIQAEAIHNVNGLQSVVVVLADEAYCCSVEMLTEEHAKVSQGHGGLQDVQEGQGAINGVDEV